MLVIVGIALMVVGVACGDFQTILANARLICLSCIGIQ
ncbi:MAG: thioredoxin [Firmicutes bacterium]|nr:thioredoxin [Bacillota bacterium]